MSNPSANTRSQTAPLYLSSYELPLLIDEDEDSNEINALLDDHPLLIPRFYHYQSLYRTIRRLEDLLEKTKTDFEDIYQDMRGHNVEEVFRHFVTRKRRGRYHPYSRSSMSNPSIPLVPFQPSPRRLRTPPPPQHSVEPMEQDGRSPSISDISYATPPELPIRFERALAGLCEKCGLSGHRVYECNYKVCRHCSGLGHEQPDFPRRDEFIVLPTGVCLSPAGEPLHDRSGNIRTRPITRSCNKTRRH